MFDHPNLLLIRWYIKKVTRDQEYHQVISSNLNLALQDRSFRIHCRQVKYRKKDRSVKKPEIRLFLVFF